MLFGGTLTQRARGPGHGQIETHRALSNSAAPFGWARAHRIVRPGGLHADGLDRPDGVLPGAGLVAAALMPQQMRAVQRHAGAGPRRRSAGERSRSSSSRPAVLVVLVISIVGLLLVIPYVLLVSLLLLRDHRRRRVRGPRVLAGIAQRQPDAGRDDRRDRHDDGLAHPGAGRCSPSSRWSCSARAPRASAIIEWRSRRREDRGRRRPRSGAVPGRRRRGGAAVRARRRVHRRRRARRAGPATAVTVAAPAGRRPAPAGRAAGRAPQVAEAAAAGAAGRAPGPALGRAPAAPAQPAAADQPARQHRRPSPTAARGSAGAPEAADPTHRGP